MGAEERGMIMSVKAKHILIVENNGHMREFYEGVFKDRADEYTIEMVDDSLAALVKLEDKRYDLIISNMLVQPLYGEMFCFYVRNDENVKINTIPIIIFSIFDKDELRYLEKFKDLAVLQRPAEEKQLFDKIEEMLERTEIEQIYDEIDMIMSRYPE